MSSSFERALHALRVELGPGAEERVRRTEVRDDGSLVFTIESLDEPLCFRFDGEHLERLEIEHETALKFAPFIVARHRAGTARILSWRPSRRMVARFDDANGTTVAKAWRKGRSAGALRVHGLARVALKDVLRVPRVESIEDGRDAARFAFFEGRELALDDLRICARIGRGVAALQDRMSAADLPRHGRAEEIEVLRAMAERRERACGTASDGWRAVFAALHALVADGSEPSVAAHRDLHDGQFAVSNGVVALFDFDLAARAEPELDVANLCAHVAWCGIQGSRGVDERTSVTAERAIVEGYAGALDERAFGFYRATTALRLALVWGMRPRWASRTERLVTIARRSLVELTDA